MKPGLCPDMPFFPADWLSSTSVSLMTPAEEGAFIRLLCHAWQDANCCLPDDDAALATLSRLGDAWSGGSGAKLRVVFVQDPDQPGKIMNPRQREIRRQQDERIKEAAEHGRKGANARWKARNARALPEHYPSTPRAMPKGMPKNASSPVSRPSVPERISLEQELRSLEVEILDLNEDRTSWNTEAWKKRRDRAMARKEQVLKALGRTA